MNQLTISEQSLDNLESKVYKVIELNKGKWLGLDDINLLTNLPFSYLLQILPLLCARGLVECVMRDYKLKYKWAGITTLASGKPYQREPIVARLTRKSKNIGSIKFSTAEKTRKIQEKIRDYFVLNPEIELSVTQVNVKLFDNKIAANSLSRILMGMPYFLDSKGGFRSKVYFLRKEQ